jgi:glycine betaine/proline transport system substrate-binding protein
MRTVADALAHPEWFPSADDPSRGAVYNCPAGWACEIFTANLFRAHDAAERGFVLVDTGSAAGLDGTIARAYERGEPWLGYYWEPTAILGKYEMVKLDDGVPHDAAAWESCTSVPDCPDPQPNGHPRAEVFAVATSAFAEKAGIAMDYISARRWGNDTVNRLLAWMSDNQAAGAEAARHFLATEEDVWSAWVAPEIADRVRAAL